MCVAFFLWRCHPTYRLYLALNRDEVHSRPTLPAHWWEGHDGILGGRDLLHGGTWFGCSKGGRLALVTSYREPHSKTDAVSKGNLTALFLQSSKSPLQYAQEVSAEMDKYNGFNLLVADLCTGTMAYVSNRPTASPLPAQEVLPGFHALSNASLDTPWPKVLRGRRKMEALVAEAGESEIPEERVVEELLEDNIKADKSALPDTGCSVEREYDLSPIFVDCQASEGGRYGSRSMSVVAVQNDGKVMFYERYLEDGCWKKHRICFEVPKEFWKIDLDG